MSDVSNPWGGPSIAEMSPEQLVELFIIIALKITAIVLFFGILDALISKEWRKSEVTRFVVHYTIYTVIVVIVVLLSYPIKSPSKSFLEALGYFLLPTLVLELAVLITVDKVRRAFVGEVPLLPDLLNYLQRKLIRGSTGRMNDLNNFGDIELDFKPLETTSQISTDSSIPSIQQIVETTTSYVMHIGNHVGSQVNLTAQLDPEYTRYREWIFRNGLTFSELSYGEFLEVKEVVNQVLGRHAFGMSSYNLDIAALSLLAKIDARENIGRLREIYDESFEKLKKFKLISERGRLMPRGVRLIKALKRRGLIEKLRKQLR